MSDPLPTTRLRIGDRERTATAERLAAHAAEGRLSVEELESRLEGANAAVFGDELAALEADLPGPPAAPPAPRRPAVPALAVLALCAAAAIALTVVVGHPVFPPFLALFLLWRFGVLQHPIRRSRP